MPARKIERRSRYFLAVEGESEQSFVAWLQMLSQERLHIHLDAVVLGGGGFNSMLRKAVKEHERRCKAFGIYRDRFLVVDGDRASKGDWSIEELKSHASEYRITVIVQKPNHEGLLLRLLPGRERRVPNASSASALLKAQWPNYEKPVNANTLRCRYSLGDLIRG